MGRRDDLGEIRNGLAPQEPGEASTDVTDDLNVLCSEGGEARKQLNLI
jgi:hypothetical protein